MSPEEYSEHEAIKRMLKQIIDNNCQLTEEQKFVAKQNVDIASQQADWLIEILRACGYLN